MTTEEERRKIYLTFRQKYKIFDLHISVKFQDFISREETGTNTNSGSQ